MKNKFLNENNKRIKNDSLRESRENINNSMNVDEKNKKEDLNRMVKSCNSLIRDYVNCNNSKYLNLSINSKEGVGMAEWSMQSFDTRCPLGFVGSIPTPDASNNFSPSAKQKMRTFDNFFEEVIALSNLYKAFELAKKGKRNKKEVIEFEKDLDANLLSLHLALLTENYSPGKYKTFYINDYKKRKITAPCFRDQIIHYALFIFLEQIYELNFIYDSYACRKNKGTHRAFKKLRKMILKYDKNDYFLKGDVSKYFYSIDQYKLKEIISRKIKDKKVLNLLSKIIDSYNEPEISAHISNLNYIKQKKGIPIGNLTSQLFANIYLNELDYFVKYKLKIKSYVRYMDDFIIVDENVNSIKRYFLEISNFLAQNLYLKLEKRKVQINKISFGVDFVGFVGFKRFVRIRSKNYRRFVKKMQKNISKYSIGKLNMQFLDDSFKSYEAHLLHTDSFTLLKRLRIKYCVQIKKAVIRGGNWNNGADAGPFYVNLNNEPTDSNSNIGFRCCQEPEKNALISRNYGCVQVHKSAPSFMKTGAEISVGGFGNDFKLNDNKINLNTEKGITLYLKKDIKNV